MILDVVKLAIGAGTHIMTNRQKRKMLESDAAMLHAQKMANGEVEYQATVRESNDKGWKDEFVLILISLPILLLIWSVFSDDPSIQEKIDIFFDKFANLPFWYQSLFIGVVASIYGLKGADIFASLSIDISPPFAPRLSNSLMIDVEDSLKDKLR